VWFDSLEPGSSWSALWSSYIKCQCRGLRRTTGLCSCCGAALESSGSLIMDIDGKGTSIPSQIFMGAEGRYEDWVYLKMIEREWKREITDSDRFLDIVESSRPAPRAIIVLIFWSYFETRIERLISEAMRDLSLAIASDLLRRYNSVGARVDRLYKILFQATYWSDLEVLGYSSVSTILQRLQRSRNEFMHGHPEAISEGLVTDLIEGLQEEHESWIAVFNKRICGTSVT
jgi:hypothetical protein